MTIDPILPDPKDPRLSRPVEGVDENGEAKSISVIEERPLTIYLNSQEIVTAMTIGDHPEYLALGFLLNQGMLKESDQVTGIDFDEELEVAVVRTAGVTDVEDKLEKKTRTSGCAVGTVFGDMMAGLEGLSLPDTPVHTSSFYDLSYQINHTPSLYMET
ncbi:MAG TPA: sulfurtransferase FdhD, partial [Marinobacter adhaerens]|nr:sulfurtransferase FdhD [Marinobacter adhaerens]